MKIDLSWGNAVCVRHAFLDSTKGKPISFGLSELEKMDYPDHDGDPALIDLTRKIIQRQVGKSYKHILLTNGAAGGITIALRAYAQRGHDIAVTNKAPYFPFYPSMISAAGLSHRSYMGNDFAKPVVLIDSPSNPQGIVTTKYSGFIAPVIWDAVYHNNVYLEQKEEPIIHDVLIGSYSKLLGLSGLRVGWIATDDSLLYERLRDLVTAEYSGLSSASAHILVSLIGRLKYDEWWEFFEENAKLNLDYNREEWNKVTKYFDDTKVSGTGMFYYSSMDKACKKLMNKSNIAWISGSSLGTNDNFGRFNLGQSCVVVRQAVREILKNDKI